LNIRRLFGCFETGIYSTRTRVSGKRICMAKMDETHRLSWPGWAPWALLAVVVTSVLTIAATLYDIL
jgi:hypothetical protein